MRRMSRCFVSIALLALIPLSASGQFDSGFGKNKVRYGSFDWQIYHSQHFDAWYYPKAEGRLETVISLAESAYDELSRAFDFQIQEPTPLILYATHSEFLQNNIIVNFIPEGVAAFATPARFRMVMPIDLPDNELYELILHELTHIFQYHIIFGGGLGRSLTMNPPQWLMEGMASYYADDESTSDRMFLRDAVVNDNIPPVTSGNVSGFFAYRYGHAVFDFMEERWGKDGVIDFIFEFRNTIGARVGRAVERAFRIEPEDFDLEFRRWLRKKYLPELVATGEPSDFGRPFRTERGNSQESSPVASPSGDLVAAFSTVKQDLDIVLFDAEKRRFLRNLTKGNQLDFRFFVAQHLSSRRSHGRDIAFSPDGNQLAAFVRREAGYTLALVNVLKGGIDRFIEMEVEQQTAPAWSPDGRYIAFAGNYAGNFDIFLLDLQDNFKIRNLTNDSVYDGAPSFSPDAERLVFTSVVGESAQIFEVALDNPAERTRITNDDFFNTDPVYSPDGRTIYFTSDRTGAENIWGIDLDRKELLQFTNAITGCFQPTVLDEPGKQNRLVYTGFWKSRFDLYETDITEPLSVTPLEGVQVTRAEDLPVFEPDILVSIDESNIEDKKGFKLYLEDAFTYAGLDEDQTLLAAVVLQFADFLGDRRLTALIQSVESFAQYRVSYTDLSRRWQWAANLYSDEIYFTSYQGSFGGGGFFDVDREQRAFKQQGASLSLIYPLSFSKRFEFDVGYEFREFNFFNIATDGRGRAVLDDNGFPITVISPREDDYPFIGAAFVSDTTIFGSSGPAGGHRIRLSASYAPDSEDTGPDSALDQTFQIDARKYIPMTRRSLIATRFFGTYRDGNFPTPTYFGGFDTLRGVRYRDIQGDRGFYANLEFRFPLIDFFVTPVFAFQGIQGRFFVDVGGAWYDGVQDFDFWDSENDRLDDALGAYGFGVTVNFFGLDLHWDFGKTYDFDQSGESFTTFWVGRRF